MFQKHPCQPEYTAYSRVSVRLLSSRMNPDGMSGLLGVELDSNLLGLPTISLERTDPGTDIMTNHIITGLPLATVEPRGFGPDKLPFAKSEFDNLSGNEIVNPFHYPGAPKLHIVLRKDGIICDDYQALKAVAHFYSYSILPTHDITAPFCYKSVFCKISLVTAYHQILLTDKDVEKTAVTSPFCLSSQVYFWVAQWCSDTPAVNQQQKTRTEFCLHLYWRFNSRDINRRRKHPVSESTGPKSAWQLNSSESWCVSPSKRNWRPSVRRSLERAPNIPRKKYALSSATSCNPKLKLSAFGKSGLLSSPHFQAAGNQLPQTELVLC